MPASESSMAPPPTIKRPPPPSLAAITTTSTSTTSSSTATTASTSSSTAASSGSTALSPVSQLDHSTEESSSSLSSTPRHFVLESLLALAKDQRYQRECQSLVCDAFSDATTTRRRRRRPGDATQTRSNTDTPTTDLFPADTGGAASPTAHLASVVAASLWATWIVWNHGKTLGMEACGLDYAGSSGTTTQQQQWKVRSATVLSLIAQCGCPFLGSANTTFSTLLGGADDDRAASASAADLRGSRRRQFHEAQRRAMVERATSALASTQHRPAEHDVPGQRQGRRHPPPSEARINRGAVADTSPNAATSRAASLRDMVGHVMRSLIVTSDPTSGLGPHDASDPNQPNPRLATFSVGTWLLRLHLAFYCLQGRFPSWFHRVFRLSLHSTSDDALVSRLSQPNNPTRLVGLFIVAQALGASVPALARLLLRTSWSPPWRRRDPPAEAAETSFAAQSHWKEIVAATDRGSAPQASAPAPACLICRQPRVRPACPPCGHVFCWSCLQQWLAERPRQHCPYCRTKCRPQQVLALHHY